jgi:hypothetical protein
MACDRDFSPDESSRGIAAGELLKWGGVRLDRVGSPQISLFLIHHAGWEEGQHGWASFSSLDLRKRVIAAIGGGMSRNQAAKQFGVAISAAINWMKRVD